MKKLVLLLIVVGMGYFSYQKFIASNALTHDALYELPYVVVYGRTSCGWTQKCLQELQAQNIDVIFKNIDKQEVKMEIFPRIDAAGHKRNQLVIPIVDVNGNILLGYEPDKILQLYQQY